jgi:hypothetical protein
MRTQPTNTDLRRLGVIVPKIAAGMAVVGVAVWLFASDLGSVVKRLLPCIRSMNRRR